MVTRFVSMKQIPYAYFVVLFSFHKSILGGKLSLISDFWFLRFVHQSIIGAQDLLCQQFAVLIFFINMSVLTMQGAVETLLFSVWARLHSELISSGKMDPMNTYSNINLRYKSFEDCHESCKVK